VLNFVTTLLSGLFIAAVTSLITVRLALWRFYSEKWWERKAELYSRLIEVLFDMHSYNRQWLEDYEQESISEAVTAFEKEKRKKHLESLRSRYQKTEVDFEKIAVIGAFIVSDAIAKDVMQLTKANAATMAEFSQRDMRKTAEESLKAIEDCLARVREHAKQDLSITRQFPAIVRKILGH